MFAASLLAGLGIFLLADRFFTHAGALATVLFVFSCVGLVGIAGW